MAVKRVLLFFSYPMALLLSWWIFHFLSVAVFYVYVCVIMLSTQQMVFCMNKLCGWQTSTLTADELAQQLVQLLRLHILSTRHTSQPLGMSASNLPVMTQTLTLCDPPVGAHGRIYDSTTMSLSCTRMQIMPVLTDLFAFPLVITVSGPSLQSWRGSAAAAAASADFSVCLTSPSTWWSVLVRLGLPKNLLGLENHGRQSRGTGRGTGSQKIWSRGETNVDVPQKFVLVLCICEYGIVI